MTGDTHSDPEVRRDRAPQQDADRAAMDRSDLRRWKRVGLAATLVTTLAFPAYLIRQSRQADMADVESTPATFVGRTACIECHDSAYQEWLGSDHDRAMEEATDSSVLGDFGNTVFEEGGVRAQFYRRDGKFLVETEGPDGRPGEFEITHTFGFEPLQQYLVPMKGGRLQALSVAWDTERKQWFFLYPGRDIPHEDWLHWTRNAQNWNGMCAECHSTNLQKNYDFNSRSFQTTWAEIDVSCEACHGPGSRHVGWARLPPMARPEVENYDLVLRTGNIEAGAEVELCAPCHSRRTEIGDYNHTHAALLDNMIPALLEEGLYYADGQILEEVYVYGSFVQSKMYRNGVRCTDCHDAHSLKLREEGNTLCLQCHQAEVYDSHDHHFHQKEYEGRPSDGRLCVKCHMPERPYMVVDWRADHSFRVPRPDLTLEVGVPNACSQKGCHDDKGDRWSAQRYAEWYGKARKPHYGTTFAAARAHLTEARAQLIRLAGDPLYPAIVRSTALRELAGFADSAAEAALNRGLSDPDPLVRHTAAQNIQSGELMQLVDRVSPLLFDDVRAIRMAAAQRLAGLPDSLFRPYQTEVLDSCIGEYIRAMSYSLDFAFAGHNLANLYASLRQPDLAERYYRAALEIDQLFFPAKVNLATLLNWQGRNDEALQLLREVVDAYPDQYQPVYSLALLLVEMNRADEALPLLERAAAGMSDYPRVHYNLGLLQQQLGRPAEAALRRAVELEPLNLQFLHALADHYVKRDRWGEAAVIADRMIEAHPEERIGYDLKEFIRNAENQVR